MHYTIRQLHPDDAASLRSIRLEALQTYPLNYTATYESESQHPVAWFATLLEQERVFGAYTTEGELFATACLTPDTRPRNEHKALLRMVYVQPAYQRFGVARALLQQVMAYAALHFEQVLLSVEAGNQRAIDLYASLGFTIYGREPRASKLLDETYLDDILMIAFVKDIHHA
jgi:ribosomal protein S18 acetylase RimI-like enzyme